VPSGSVSEPIVIPSIRIRSDTGAAFQSQVVNGLMVTIAGVDVLSQEQRALAFAVATEFDPDFSFGNLLFGLPGSGDNLAFATVTVRKDTDADGIADVDDGCRGDPAKTAPGTCGCGVQDVDGDGSGVLDCLIADELRLSCDGLLDALGRLRPIRRGQGRKKRELAAAQGEVVRRLLGVTQAQVARSGGAVVPADLAAKVEASVSRALNLRSRRFRANKRKATQAVRAMRAALG
jgi:hypothetical protein